MSNSAFAHIPGRDLLFQEWILANRIAHIAEKAVARACLAFVEGVPGSGWPPLEEFADVNRLRATADDLFAAAMAQTIKRAGGLRRY